MPGVVMVMWFLSERKRYVIAMLKAINKAREPILIDEKWQSKTDGLRVIKRFERVNKTKFDPHNKRHLEMIRGNASHEHFFRKAGYVFSRHLNT